MRERHQPKPHEILAAFRGPIEPVRVGLFYSIGMLVAAAAMTLLPVLYLALIAVMGFGVYLHATGNHDVLIGRGFIGMFLYFAPVLAGATSLLFMIKPLFSGRRARQTTMALRREDEPFLFDFIERVCRLTGAPVPERIEADCDINASASFTGGWPGFFSGSLTLRIGLPFVAGMNLRQFTGVLAHELGHFTQGFAMRFSYLIRSTNDWFARVVYERDGWDEWLDNQAETSGSWIYVLAQLCRFFVWLSRRILWILMMTGHAISCFLQRQMEFNADLHEARMVGSGVFETTIRRLMELGVAQQAAGGVLHRAWNEQRLCDNYPSLLVAQLAEVGQPGLSDAISQAISNSKTHFLATHPADSERIRRVASESAEGKFHLECPATLLFRDFNSIARAASVEYYRDVLGDRFRLGQLVSTDEIIRHEEAHRSAHEAMPRCFGTLFFTGEGFFPRRTPVLPVRDLDSGMGELRELRARLDRALPLRRARFRELHRLRTRKRHAEHYLALSSRGVIPPENTFDPPIRSQEQALHLLHTAEEKLPSLLAEYRGHMEDQADRLRGAMCLLASSEFDPPDLKAAEAWPRARAFMEVLSRISMVFPDMKELRDTVDLQRLMFLGIRLNEKNERVVQHAMELNGRLTRLLGDLASSTLRDLPNPFASERRKSMVGEMVPPVAGLDVGGIFAAAEGCADDLFAFYARTTGELFLIVERVELAGGLPGMTPDPEDLKSIREFRG